MANKIPYFEKLKDPRWQKKRLQMLEGSDWTCEVCGDSETTLHVHHKQYLKGKEPWEYDDRQLAVLCEDCHTGQHAEPDLLNLVTSFALLDGPFSRRELAFMLAGVIGVEMPEATDYESSLYDMGYTSVVVGYWNLLESRKKRLVKA